MSKHKYIWIILFIILAMVRAIASPQIIETYYFNGLFPIIRNVFDYTFGLLPFASLYVIFFVFTIWFSLQLKRVKWLKIRQFTFQKLISIIITIANTISFILFWFLLLWGMNYGRPSLESKLKILGNRYNKSQLIEEWEETNKKLLEVRLDLNSDTLLPINFEKIKHFELETKIRNSLTSQLQRWGYSTPGRVRARLLYPKGILLRISTAGVYLPWTAEGHIDPGMHILEQPYVMAHEMSHGYGFTDEGICNFIAFRALSESPQPMLQYSALISYWFYVASAMQKTDPSLYQTQFSQLPQIIKKDIQEIKLNLRKYPDILPKIRDFAYDQYLKSQGVKEGLISYNRIVNLNIAYKNQTLIKH